MVTCMWSQRGKMNLCTLYNAWFWSEMFVKKSHKTTFTPKNKSNGIQSVRRKITPTYANEVYIKSLWLQRIMERKERNKTHNSIARLWLYGDTLETIAQKEKNGNENTKCELVILEDAVLRSISDRYCWPFENGTQNKRNDQKAHRHI